MKKFFIFAILVSLLIFGIIFFKNNGYNNNSGNNYSGAKLSANINEDKSNIANTVETQDKANANKETEISSFSTKILDDTPGRLTNISITCSTLNNTVVHAGETFSFNQVVGKPTAERGYQEAKIIVDHEAEMGIGGRKLPSK